MKNIITLTLFSSLLLGCSSLPSYHEMSCTDLKEKEKSLQSDYKADVAGSIISGIADIVEDTTESTVDSIASDLELNATKKELREVQSIIHQKRCK